MGNIPYATQQIEADDIQAVAKALRSDWLTQGPKVREFEAAVAAYCGARYAVAFNSGTSALHGACRAAGIDRGDRAVTSPITFVASANCVLYCGGRPLFADVEPETVNIDLAEIERLLKGKNRAKIKALIPVHFAGQPCDLAAISKLARKHGLTVIEDACHALGAEYKGSKIGGGRYSDLTVMSFHAVKHITTGEGGMVLTNRRDYYEKLLAFRTHGITREPGKMKRKNEGPWYYEMQDLGFNYRITDFQCALGLSQLKKLDGFVARRRQIVAEYGRALNGLAGLVLPSENAAVKSSWHIYPVRVKKDRKRVFNELRARGIGVNVHYLPVYRQPYYEQLGYKRGLCPKAEAYYDEAITLPLFPKMTDRQVGKVVDALRASLREKK